MGLPQASPPLYKYRMQALAFLAHNEATCYQIARDTGFSAFLVGRLTDTELSLIAINWDVFRIYARYDKVLIDLLGQPKITSKLAQIVSCDCTAVLRRFFEWSISVWRNEAHEVTVKFCDAMLPAIGQITCIVKARKTMFRDDLTLVKLIEDYAIAIVELEAPGAEKFIDAFSKHMEMTEIRDEVGAAKRPKIRRETIKLLTGSKDLQGL
jgi:hypothetical protein